MYDYQYIDDNLCNPFNSKFNNDKVIKQFQPESIWKSGPRFCFVEKLKHSVYSEILILLVKSYVLNKIP